MAIPMSNMVSVFLKLIVLLCRRIGLRRGDGAKKAETTQ